MHIDRRNFLSLLPLSFFSFSENDFLQFNSPSNSDKTNSDRLQKVINAMLCMQRASWEQGVAMQALWELGETQLAYLMAKESVLRQLPDGRLSVLYTDNGVTDPAASGEVVLKISQETGDNEFVEAHKKMLDFILNKAPKSSGGIIYHILSGPEIWIDSMYMLPPFLSTSGEYNEAVKQIKGIRKALWNPEKKLYSHRWHDEKKTFPNKKFWGVGNGWALAGIARVIDHLPENMHAERNILISYELENIEGCLHYLRPDGLFHNVIDDPNTFIETNLSQMLAYTIYRGIKSGWLSDVFFEKAEIMRKAAISKVDRYGFVADVCGAPHFNSPGRATEGQAFFLLMEAARKKLPG